MADNCPNCDHRVDTETVYKCPECDHHFWQSEDAFKRNGKEEIVTEQDNPVTNHSLKTKKCPHCHNRVSYEAVFCKHCGKKFARFNNWFYLIPLTILLFAFYYILGGTDGSGDKTKKSATAPATEAKCYEQDAIQKAKASTHLVGQYDRKDNLVSYGSGFAINDPATNGLVITNYHVIEGTKTIKVWIGYDGKEWINASVFAAYPDQDIALLKVDYNFFWKSDLLDSDKLKPAETLYAIGWPNDPTGEATITKGIFSRRISEEGFDIIQTDASINPGNSGGPLINACGVIGMNTAKLTWSDNSTPAEGTGYALSSKYIDSITIKK